MTKQPLSERIAVVTGASAGIGASIARELALAGCQVVVNARRDDRLTAVARDIKASGGVAVACPGDCADHAVVLAMLDLARERFGGEADLVVANAGRGLAGSVCTSDASQWDEMLRTNIAGVALLVRLAAERLTRSDGASFAKPRDIVILGSNVGKHVSPFSSMYGSTKFAVGAIAEGARRELGPKGVRVSLVCPGIVKSEFQQVAGYSEEWARDFFGKFEPVLEPEDVARLVRFIAEQPPHVHINDAVIRPTKQDYP